MNQALNRRLRTCYLLLLAPWLVALVEIPVALGPAHHLKIVSLSAPVIAGAPVTFTVGVFDEAGNLVPDYDGTIHFEASAARKELPASYTFNPAEDQGKHEFSVRFLSAGPTSLQVLDSTGGILSAEFSSILVAPGQLDHFRIELPTTWVAGDTHPLFVIPEDEFGNEIINYAGQVHFELDDPQSSPPDDGALDRTLSLTLKTAGKRTLQVIDRANTQITGSLSIEVVHNRFEKMALYSFATGTMSACEVVTLEVRALDSHGNTVTEPLDVSLCKQSDRLATWEYSEIVGSDRANDCLSGMLPDETGVARVKLRSQESNEVEVSVSNTTTTGPVTVIWDDGVPSGTTSALSFPDSSTDPPALRARIGQLTLHVALRNACERPVVLAEDRLSIAGHSALKIDSPSPAAADGEWTAKVRLPECPTNSPEQLALWPLVDNEPLITSTGSQLERAIVPLCSELRVTLSASPKEEGQVVEPGALVEFVVEISNEDDATIPAGVLKLNTRGMTLLEARHDAELLEPHSKGFKLPELQPDTKLIVTVKAQSSAQLDQPVEAEVWYTTSDGSGLTEPKTVSFERSAPGVDVGCGCQSGDLPSQFLPWLALLLAASRPWERLRRLQRGERIDH